MADSDRSSSRHVAPRWRRSTAGIALTAALLAAPLSAPSSAGAAATTWTGAISGSWAVPGNWAGGVPTNGSDVIFPAGAANKVNSNDLPLLSLHDITIEDADYQIEGLGLAVTGNVQATQASGLSSINTSVAFDGAPHTVTVSEPPATLRFGTGTFGGVSANFLAKAGDGLLTLDATHSGAMTVAAGAVAVDADGSTSMTVNNAVITGVGSAGATTVAGGLVVPGEFGTSGVLSLGPTQVDANSAFFTRLSSTAFGQLAVDGNLALNQPELFLDRTEAAEEGQVFPLAVPTGSVSGTFAGLPQGAQFALGSQGYEIDYAITGTVGVALTALNTPFPEERFIDAVYLDLLSRFVDLDALVAWLDALDLGLPRAFMAALVNTSGEYRENMVVNLYESLLRRSPDPDGLELFVSFLGRGARNEDVMAALVSSAEYFENVGGANTDDYLVALYEDLLGRAPDPTGFDGFGPLLDAGAPRSVIAYALLNSNEYRANLVDQLYLHLLHRAADPGGRNFFVSMLGTGASDEIVIDFIAGSAEYFNRAQGSLVPATVSATALSASNADTQDPLRVTHPPVPLLPT